jgi:ribosomal protein L12E/L44/L45/RPP1/RPP2
VGVEADADELSRVLKELEGKDVKELIEAGRKKLQAVPSGGGGGAAPAAGGAAPAAGGAAKKEEKKEEPSEEDEVRSRQRERERAGQEGRAAAGGVGDSNGARDSSSRIPSQRCCSSAVAAWVLSQRWVGQARVVQLLQGMLPTSVASMEPVDCKACIWGNNCTGGCGERVHAGCAVEGDDGRAGMLPSCKGRLSGCRSLFMQSTLKP